MFRRSQVTQNKDVARLMRAFFNGLSESQRSSGGMARAYGSYLWNDRRDLTLAEQKLARSRSRFYVGISTDDVAFEDLTKRAALVTDTLLLTHSRESHFRRLGIDLPADQADPFPTTPYYGMHVPDMNRLGRWLLDCEPLLRAGLLWYLPSYAIRTDDDRATRADNDTRQAMPVDALDLLVRDGRAVEVSGTAPLKSQVVRPVLEIDLPFIDGVELDVFSKITREEFRSYSAFRDRLRRDLLSLDDAVNAVQSERELAKIGIDIADGVRSVEAQMKQTRRKRALSVTGAAIGTTTAILVAVYGTALADVVATIGASGGVWSMVNAWTENNPRGLQDDKWYYVWALARANRRYTQ